MRATLIANPDVYNISFVSNIMLDEEQNPVETGSYEYPENGSLDLLQYRSAIIIATMKDGAPGLTISIGAYSAEDTYLGSTSLVHNQAEPETKIFDLRTLVVTAGAGEGTVLLAPRLKLNFNFANASGPTDPSSYAINLHLFK